MKKRIICALTAAVFVVAIFGGCAKKATTQTSVQEEQIGEIPEEKRVSFYGAGDNLIHNCLYWQAEKNTGGTGYDFKPMYSLVADDIKNADISYINQETILGGTQMGLSSYPLFNSPQELGRDMMELGFDVFSHATNHVFDKWEKGIANTYEFYKNHSDATCIGIYKKGEDNIKVVEKNDIKIAFVNYTYHTNGLSLAQDSDYYVPLADYDDDCRQMIKTVKKADSMADFVVCCLHWGDEDSTIPNQIQEKSAKLLSENGCDVIIGTHPHAIQPIEYVGNTLVVYSLGNYISAQVSPVNLMGLTVGFDFVKVGDKTSIEDVWARGVVTQYENRFSNIRIIPFDLYTPSLAKAHGADVEYEYFENLLTNTIDEKYLTNRKN